MKIDNIITHKRIWDRTYYGSSNWALCQPDILFKTYELSTEWRVYNRFQWREVNCPECLKIKVTEYHGIRNLKKKEI